MKKVTSFLVLAAALLVAGNAHAQLGINIGYAPETITTTAKNGNSSLDMAGFFAGVNYNHALSGNIGISFGAQLRYNTKKTTNTVLSATTTTTHTQLLLDIPVLLNFSIPFGNDASLALYAGPTLTYALKGSTNTKGSESISGLSGEGTYNWYGENSNRKQFDLLGTFGAAFNYKNIRLFGGYRLGLLDLDKSDNVTVKTSGLFFGLGYKL